MEYTREGEIEGSKTGGAVVEAVDISPLGSSVRGGKLGGAEE
jgi:hypothetical protein